jgi:hypothetical protein
VDPDDLGTAILIGHANLEFAVEATGAPQSWIDGVTAIGGSNDDDVVAALHPVE